MVARSIGSASISFGLVSIAVGVYAATAAKRTGFTMLHKACGSPIRQQMVCPQDAMVVDRSDTARGYEYFKGQYVRFSDDDLKALEADRTNLIEIKEFVPESSVDLLHIQETHFLGPEKKAEKAYQLLAHALAARSLVAVARFATRGKDDVVIVRPYKNGLVLHKVFYADEMRSIEDIAFASVDLLPEEIASADALIAQMSCNTFDPSKYEDKWRVAVQRAVDQKVAGQQVEIPSPTPTPIIVDLLEALKKSIDANANASVATAPSPPEIKPGPAKTRSVAKRDRKKKTA